MFEDFHAAIDVTDLLAFELLAVLRVENDEAAAWRPVANRNRCQFIYSKGIVHDSI